MTRYQRDQLCQVLFEERAHYNAKWSEAKSAANRMDALGHRDLAAAQSARADMAESIAMTCGRLLSVLQGPEEENE